MLLLAPCQIEAVSQPSINARKGGLLTTWRFISCTILTFHSLTFCHSLDLLQQMWPPMVAIKRLDNAQLSTSFSCGIPLNFMAMESNLICIIRKQCR